MAPRKKGRPLQWLRNAAPAEIGEALLAVDRVKAAQVVAYLIQRVGPELDTIAERVQDNLVSDPLGTLGKALIGMSRGRRQRD